MEPFEFGPLGSFVLKSAVLISIITLCSFLLRGLIFGWALNLIVWWIGLIVLFRQDFWQSKVLVILLWGVHFVAGIGVMILITSLMRPAVP
jgi:hypothetical protein